MEKIIKDSLSLLGLSDKESKFFLACFSLGNTTINEVAKKARLERSTAYLIAQELIQKGLLEEDSKEYRKTIIAAEPRRILRMLSAKQRVIGRQELELRESLPELQAIYQSSVVLPQVRVFQGKSGLLQIQEDLLAKEQELLLWTNQETEHEFFTPQYHKAFISLRKQSNIPIRVLAVNNYQGEALQKNDKQNLRQTKLLPEDTTFTAETYVYGDKIAVLDYKKDIIGVIIQSEQIAASQRAMFELVWQLF